MKNIEWADVVGHYFDFDIKIEIDYKQVKNNSIVSKVIESVLTHVDDRDWCAFLAPSRKDSTWVCVPVVVDGVRTYATLSIKK